MVGENSITRRLTQYAKWLDFHIGDLKDIIAYNQLDKAEDGNTIASLIDCIPDDPIAVKKIKDIYKSRSASLVGRFEDDDAPDVEQYESKLQEDLSALVQLIEAREKFYQGFPEFMPKPQVPQQGYQQEKKE